MSISGTLIIPNPQEQFRQNLLCRLHKYHDNNGSKDLYDPICEKFREELKYAADRGVTGVKMMVAEHGKDTNDMFNYIRLQFPPDYGYSCVRSYDHSTCDCDASYTKGCTTYITVHIV